MKKICFSLSQALVLLTLSCNLRTTYTGQAINPVIGDISFITKFGCRPDAATDEDTRIKTHFEYVEELLRQKDVTGLSAELRQKRTQLLDLLHTYREAGIFPRNYDYDDKRKPCFIDRDNRICAVGYLIEKTAGRRIAEDINSRYKYSTIYAMNDKVVDAWISSSGLSKEECAIIQPTYGPAPTYTYNYVTPAYGISSSVLSGLNLSLNTVNGMQIAKGTNSATIAIAGLIGGAGQAVLGAAMYPKTKYEFYGRTVNERRQSLSMINIGVGTATMILSAWNLLTNGHPKDKKTTWNFNGISAQGNTVGMAIGLKRRF